MGSQSRFALRALCRSRDSQWRSRLWLTVYRVIELPDHSGLSALKGSAVAVEPAVAVEVPEPRIAAPMTKSETTIASIESAIFFAKAILPAFEASADDGTGPAS